MTSPGGEVWHVVVGLTRGGAESLLVGCLPGLQERGQRPRVVALKGWGPVGDDLEKAGIPVLALGGRGRLDPRPLWTLLRHLRRCRPQRVHAHLTRAVIAAGWACRLAGIPLVAHFHSLAGRRPAWQDRLEGAATRQAVARIAVSRAVAADRAKRFHLPLTAFEVVPNGIRTERFAAVPDLHPAGDAVLRCGFLGRLQVEDKGLDVLLEGLARLRQRSLDGIRLEIAGGPPEIAAALQQRARALGVEHLVHFLGEVADPLPLLARWDLLVLPSRREGFGLVLTEAMAAGRPVLTSDAGGIPEVVVQGVVGWMVPAGDPAALADALALRARDRAGLTACGARARRHAREHFNVTRMAAEWHRISEKSPEKTT